MAMGIAPIKVLHHQLNGIPFDSRLGSELKCHYKLGGNCHNIQAPVDHNLPALPTLRLGSIYIIISIVAPFFVLYGNRALLAAEDNYRSILTDLFKRCFFCDGIIFLPRPLFWRAQSCLSGNEVIAA